MFASPAEGADPAQTDIYSIKPDGSALKRLTTSAPDAAGNVQPQGSPALSPNRTQIVYVSVTSDNVQSQLRIMNVDGTNNRLLSSDSNLNGATVPTWSPDGNRIAFSKGNDGIFIVNANGTGLRQLTTLGANPSWSINNQIAFNAAPNVQASSQALKRGTRGVLPPGTSANNDIWVVGVAGSGLRQLTQRSQTETGLASINPSWSPDGRTLVFNSLPGSGVDAKLYLVNADGTNRRSLANLTGTDAAFSPDASQIVYSATNGLSVVGVNGSNPKLLNASAELFVEDTDWR